MAELLQHRIRVSWSELVSPAMATIVLLHGYPLDATAFAGVVPLVDSDHNVFVPDLAGFGSQPWPSDGDLSMSAQASHVLARMDAEGIDSACVVGLSMGGYVALAMARRAPNRVRALGLIGSKPDPDTPEAREGRNRQAELVVSEGASTLVGPLTAALLAPTATLVVKARLRTMIERTRVETYVSALAGMRDRDDTSDVIESFDGPVAAMVGAFDNLVSVERNEQIAASAVDGVAITVGGAGHLVPMEDPRSVATFIADLARRT